MRGEISYRDKACIAKNRRIYLHGIISGSQLFVNSGIAPAPAAYYQQHHNGILKRKYSQPSPHSAVYAHETSMVRNQ